MITIETQVFLKEFRLIGVLLPYLVVRNDYFLLSHGLKESGRFKTLKLIKILIESLGSLGSFHRVGMNLVLPEEM